MLFSTVPGLQLRDEGDAQILAQLFHILVQLHPVESVLEHQEL